MFKEAIKISERTYLIDGMRFTRPINRKYYRNTKTRTDLHRYLWIVNFGEIPAGMHVHHKDKNTENNNVENLCLMKASEHIAMHSNEIDKVKLRENLEKNARPKACEWHSSTKGREWHKLHYEKMKEKLHVVKKYFCEYCGKEFESAKTNSRFCSNVCKSKSRRESGVDNVVKKCKFCGKEFVINKYSKTETCSKSCGLKLSWKSRNN